MTRDCKRNGTSTLFAALEVSSGRIVGECMKRRRHTEFLKFMKRVEGGVPENLDLHVIVDNYGAHRHAKVKKWLEKRPRVHFHFIPTSSSWSNPVERFFGLLTERQLKRGILQSVKQLEDAIVNYIDNRNGDPKPFVRTKSVGETMDKVNRAKAALQNVQSN